MHAHSTERSLTDGAGGPVSQEILYWRIWKREQRQLRFRASPDETVTWRYRNGRFYSWNADGQERVACSSQGRKKGWAAGQAIWGFFSRFCHFKTSPPVRAFATKQPCAISSLVWMVPLLRDANQFQSRTRVSITWNLLQAVL